MPAMKRDVMQVVRHGVEHLTITDVIAPRGWYHPSKHIIIPLSHKEMHLRVVVTAPTLFPYLTKTAACRLGKIYGFTPREVKLEILSGGIDMDDRINLQTVRDGWIRYSMYHGELFVEAALSQTTSLKRLIRCLLAQKHPSYVSIDQVDMTKTRRNGTLKTSDARTAKRLNRQEAEVWSLPGQERRISPLLQFRDDVGRH